jgi:hypothetical protein
LNRNVEKAEKAEKGRGPRGLGRKTYSASSDVAVNKNRCSLSGRGRHFPLNLPGLPVFCIYPGIFFKIIKAEKIRQFNFLLKIRLFYEFFTVCKAVNTYPVKNYGQAALSKYFLSFS